MIYGLTGEKFSGKDTVANAIIARYARSGKKAQRVAFAEPLKQALCVMFGWEREKLEDHIFKETPEPITGQTPRKIMQYLGTEFGRELLHDEIWLRLANQEIERLKADGIIPVVTDVRFENEAAFVRSIGGQIIHVVNPDTVQRTDVHASENGVRKEVNDWSFINDKGAGLVPVYNFVDRVVVV